MQLKRFLPMMCLLGGVVIGAPVPYYPAPIQVSRMKLSPVPKETAKVISLNGTWKLSPVQQSAKPFADDAELTSDYVKPEFNDEKWRDIAVPLDWFKGGHAKRDTAAPYSMGWYRRKFTLERADIKEKQILIDIQRLGYEGVFFVNGQQVPQKHFGDFVPSQIDITPFVKAGDNTLAVRVRTDLGASYGRKEPVTHTYGSQWSSGNIRGGMWGDVSLRIEPAVRIAKLMLVPHIDRSSVEARIVLKSLNATPVGLRMHAEVRDAVEGRGLALVGSWDGAASESIVVPLQGVKLWSLEAPQLYYFTLTLVDASGRNIASHTERFGQREFTIQDRKFCLNGKPIYLFGENIPSVNYGGYGLSSEEEKKLEDYFSHVKSLGYVMVRTSHSPIMPKALEIADELGLMIFHEWGWAFTTNINEEAFEKDNLDEIVRYVEESHNHPCVTMWSLGNEVSHTGRPFIARQFDKQYDRVKAADWQKRPISIFSGSAGWHSYGRNPVKTDVHDYHTYVSLSEPWTNRDYEAKRIYDGLLEIYGEQNELSRPLVAWENVGFSWGWKHDKNFHDGDVDDYLKYSAVPTGWGQPNGIGFAGCWPLSEVLSVSQSVPMNYYCRRIFELYRLDRHYQGFAPWSGGTKPQASTLWNQIVFPTIHDERNFSPNHLYMDDERTWTAEIVNSGNQSYEKLVLTVTLVQDGNEDIAVVGRYELPNLPEQEHCKADIRMCVTGVDGGRYQMRLKLTADGKHIGQNYYDIYVQKRSIVEGAIQPVRAVYVYNSEESENVRALCNRLELVKIPFRVVSDSAALPDGSVLIIPPEVKGGQSISRDKISGFRTFVERGGFLFVLEQQSTTSCWFPGMPMMNGYPMTFSDMVVTDHPIFKNLDRHLFNTWDNDDRNMVVSYSYRPINANVLMARGPKLNSSDVGMSVLEGTFGKGRVLCSQLNVFMSLERDSVAAEYLHNVLEYVCAAPKWYEKARPFVEREGVTYRSVPERTRQIDLRAFMNRSFTDDKADDMAGGWTDQGDNDFRMMPVGRQNLGGIEFEVVDPATNNDKSCIVLAGTGRPKFPQFAKDIPLKGKYSRLFFLHTAAWGSAKDVGSYRFHYADGTTDSLKLVGKQNIGDWWNSDALLDGIVGLKAFQKTNEHDVFLYVTSWENPNPEKDLVSFDFLSPMYNEDNAVDWLPTATGVPVLVAVTGELVSENNYSMMGKRLKSVYSVDTQGTGYKANNEITPERTIRVTFAPTSNYEDGCFFWKFDVDAEKLKTPFTGLTMRIKSDSDMSFSIRAPKADWKHCYTSELHVKGDNVFHVYRFMVPDGLRNTTLFQPKDLRGEFFFFPFGKSMKVRPKVVMEIEAATWE